MLPTWSNIINEMLQNWICEYMLHHKNFLKIYYYTFIQSSSWEAFEKPPFRTPQFHNWSGNLPNTIFFVSESRIYMNQYLNKQKLCAIFQTIFITIFYRLCFLQQLSVCGTGLYLRNPQTHFYHKFPTKALKKPLHHCIHKSLSKDLFRIMT